MSETATGEEPNIFQQMIGWTTNTVQAVGGSMLEEWEERQRSKREIEMLEAQARINDQNTQDARSLDDLRASPILSTLSNTKALAYSGIGIAGLLALVLLIKKK